MRPPSAPQAWSPSEAGVLMSCGCDSTAGSGQYASILLCQTSCVNRSSRIAGIFVQQTGGIIWSSCVSCVLVRVEACGNNVGSSCACIFVRT